MSSFVCRIKEGIHGALDALNPGEAQERKVYEIAVKVAKVVATGAGVYFAACAIFNPGAALYYFSMAYLSYEITVLAKNELTQISNVWGRFGELADLNSLENRLKNLVKDTVLFQGIYDFFYVEA